MLPAQRGRVGEQSIRDRVAAAAIGIQRPPKIDGVPQRDGCRDQREAASAVLLALGGAVVQPPKTVEAHGAGQRVAAWFSVKSAL